jgi:hypothetical protein
MLPIVIDHEERKYGKVGDYSISTITTVSML